MKLVIMGFGLQMVDCLLPVGGQDVAVVADQALIDLSQTYQLLPGTNAKNTYVCPCSLVELWYRSKALTCKLQRDLAFLYVMWIATSCMVIRER